MNFTQQDKQSCKNVTSMLSIKRSLNYASFSSLSFLFFKVLVTDGEHSHFHGPLDASTKP